MAEPNHCNARGDDVHRLPAPHDRIEFKVCGSCVEYSGTVEDLISAGVVTAQMLRSKRLGGKVPERGARSRHHAGYGRVILRFLKCGLVVEFVDALERGVKLPGVTDAIVAAAQAKADAEWRDYEARTARPVEPEPGRNSVNFRLGRELGGLSAIADDDATAEDLIALMPEFKAKLMARKSKRAERARPSFLKLVIDNEVRP